MLKTRSTHTILIGAFAMGIATPALANAPTGERQDETETDWLLVDSKYDPVALDLAGKIVDLGYPEDRREEIFFATMDQSVSQMRRAIAPSLPSGEPGAVAILDDWIEEYTAQSKDVLRKHIPAIMEGMTQAYASVFSKQELADILAFVETTSGQRYFELSPAIVGSPSFADANQRYLEESLKLLGPAREDLSDRISEYMEDKAARDAPPDT